MQASFRGAIERAVHSRRNVFAPSAIAKELEKEKVKAASREKDRRERRRKKRKKKRRQAEGQADDDDDDDDDPATAMGESPLRMLTLRQLCFRMLLMLDVLTADSAPSRLADCTAAAISSLTVTLAKALRQTRTPEAAMPSFLQQMVKLLGRFQAQGAPEGEGLALTLAAGGLPGVGGRDGQAHSAVVTEAPPAEQPAEGGDTGEKVEAAGATAADGLVAGGDATGRGTERDYEEAVPQRFQRVERRRALITRQMSTAGLDSLTDDPPRSMQWRLEGRAAACHAHLAGSTVTILNYLLDEMEAEILQEAADEADDDTPEEEAARAAERKRDSMLVTIT